MKTITRSTLQMTLFALLTTGAHTFANPIIDNKKSIQPLATLSYARSSFNAVCAGGPCSGSAGTKGPDLTGWTWATASELGDLSRMFTPLPGGSVEYYSSSYDTVQEFLDNTGRSFSTTLTLSEP